MSNLDNPPPPDTKMFQIKEPDLAELERLLPRLVDRLYRPDMTNRERVQIRKVQNILSDVRWNYGPHTEIEEIDP